MGVFVDHRRTEVLDMQHKRGTIFSLVDAAERYIAANIRRRFVVTDARDEVPEIPRKAIRESLLNAYAHRVWHRSGYVQIDIYHDAVDVINPGWFIDGRSPEAHIDGESTPSDARNRLIADTLFRSGDIESSGFGLPLIRDLCADAGVRFTYEEIPFGTKLTFHRNDPFAESLPDIAESREWATLSDGERAVAELLAASGTLRTNQVAEMLGLPARTARYTLQKLVEKGVAEVHGSTRSRTYSIHMTRKA